VEVTTKTVDSFFPYQMLWFLVSSPAQYDKLGKDWDKFASQPSGTGPFKLTKLVPRELAELSKNEDYWNKKRLPKVDKLILIPMPEALTRTNALLAGQVDLIETPAPDAVPQLKSAGMRIPNSESMRTRSCRIVGSMAPVGRMFSAMPVEPRTSAKSSETGISAPVSPSFRKPVMQFVQIAGLAGNRPKPTRPGVAPPGPENGALQSLQRGEEGTCPKVVRNRARPLCSPVRTSRKASFFDCSDMARLYARRRPNGIGRRRVPSRQRHR